MNIINTDSDIHSDKVKKLLGEEPILLIRYGTLIGILFVIIIGIILLTLPYPNGNGECVYNHIL